jgi:hypothetical protein
MVDREKIVNVLLKRFPAAPAHEIAAAANAIVGLHPEYEPVVPPDVDAFECIADTTRYTVDDLASGRVRLYRRFDGS